MFGTFMLQHADKTVRRPHYAVRGGLGPVLELRGVSKAFGSLVALAEIDLKIMPGERCAILGANGAGKTTLFNAISGDFPISSGEVRLLGQDVTSLPTHDRVRRGLRRTYQISQLFGGLSVRENMYLACRGILGRRFSVLHPKASDVALKASEDLLHAVKLYDQGDALVATLSHGQQRQLEIGLALAHNPNLILFDEPAAGLSPAERGDLIAILQSLPKQIAFVLIEHDMDVALRVADRVIMMHNGEIFKEGLPEDIEKDAAVQELYLGTHHG